MASEYNWDLPSSFDFDSSASSSWSDNSANTSGYQLSDTASGGYDYSGTNTQADPQMFDFNDDDWYVDSGSSAEVDTAMFDDLWNWAKSDQGTAVLGGASNMAFKMWMADLANKEARKNKGKSESEYRDARIAAHNASINAPVNVGLTKLQRP